ncbi:hypothetical protein TeGR_g5663, partial [Tetraparma gracilis]
VVLSIADIPLPNPPASLNGAGGAIKEDEEEDDALPPPPDLSPRMSRGSSISSQNGEQDPNNAPSPNHLAPVVITHEDVHIECLPVSLPWQLTIEPEETTVADFRARFDAMEHRLRHSFACVTFAASLAVTDHALRTWRGKRLYLRLVVNGKEGSCELRSDDAAVLGAVSAGGGVGVLLRRFLPDMVGQELKFDVLESMEQREEESAGREVRRSNSVEMRQMFSF